MGENPVENGSAVGRVNKLKTMGGPPDWQACRDALARGLMAMGQEPEAARDGRLVEYIDELSRWNRTYNLTAVRNPVDMVARHLLDSLSIVSYLRGQSIADIGSGAGLPGIPLAMACPDRHFALVESSRKRVAFLRHVQRRLALDNVDVIHSRAEAYRQSTGGFDMLVVRAVAPLDRLLPLCAHLCAPGGRILAMKGRDPEAELAALPSGVAVLGVHRLDVAQESAERHLIILRPEQGTG